MSQIQLDHLAAVLPIEPPSTETGLLQILPAGADSFDNHLQRAQSRPDEPASADAEPSRRPADVQPAADDREDAPPAEPRAEAAEEPPPEQAVEDAPAGSGAEEQTAVQDAGDGAEDHPDEASGENAETELNVVLAGGQPADALTDEVTGKAAVEQPGRTANDSQDAGSRRGLQGRAAEQDDPWQQSPVNGASARVVAEVQPEGTAPAGDDETLLQTAAEPTGAAGEKSEEPADDAGEKSENPAQPGGKKKPAATAEKIMQHAGETGRAADVANPLDAEVLPADTPQSRRRSRGKKDSAVEGNDRSASYRVAAKSAAPNSVAAPGAQAITAEAAAGGEVRGEPAVHTGGPATNDATGSQNETSTRDGAAGPASTASSKGPQQGAADGVDRVRFVQRVARAFEAISDRSRSVRLRLSPPELGSLRLEVTVRNGVMNARVEAETATARNLLLDNLGALRERLAQQDIKIDQFTVDLTGRSPGGPFGDRAGQTQGQDGDSANDPQRPDADAETPQQNDSNTGAVSRPGEGTQLNVVI